MGFEKLVAVVLFVMRKSAGVLLSTISGRSLKTLGLMPFSSGLKRFYPRSKRAVAKDFERHLFKRVINSPVREFLEAKLPEPGSESIWSAEGNRASKRLTRCPANYNRALDSRARHARLRLINF
jgi:hypothetical protein